MTGPFSTRRRAEEFDAALSRPLTEQDASAFAELLTVVRDLRAVSEPAPRAEFVSDLRFRLMAEADTALLPQAARHLTAVEQRLVLPVHSHRRDRRLAAVLGAAALIGATTSMAVAAQTSLPGESLYPIKRALENAQTGIAGGDTAKGQALLANATGRLDEVRDLAERGDQVSLSAVASTLESFSDQADEASVVLLAAFDTTGDEAVITELRSFTGSSMDRLSAMESTLPASTREGLVAAGQRLADIDQQASQQCPSCGGDATSIPRNLLTGGNVSNAVTTMIVAASQDPGLLKQVKSVGPTLTSPTSPDALSGQDVDGVTVPDLEVPGVQVPGVQVPGVQVPGVQVPGVQNPGVQVPGVQVPKPSATRTPHAKGTRPKVDVKTPVNEVTKLLTGDLSTATSGLPVANQVLTGVGTTLNGTVDGVQGTLDGVTGSLFP